jgi:hypothetical protein
LIAHPFLTPDVQTWTFQADGLGVRKLITHETYLNLLQLDMDGIKNSKGGAGFFCTGQESEGKELMDQLMITAEQNNIGVVLYQSPVNGTILQKLVVKDDRFYQCQKTLTDFMNYLESKHKNVRYVNLIDYKPITDLKEEGFYDTRHLRPNASQAVIDQLIPSIQAVVQWSEAQDK